MMRLFITTILIVCFSAISAAAKGGIETTVTRLKCISTFSDYLHSGEITLTVAENFDVYINDPYRYTGEMVYNGEMISDGKLKQVKWSGKIISFGGQLLAQEDPMNSAFHSYYAIDTDTWDVYLHSVDIFLEKLITASDKAMTCAEIY